MQNFGWLAPGEMLDGLGMAETTPGPLIMVTQFVGFMGAFRDASGMPPLLAGTFGGLLTTWVTFTRCFLWIFLGAPFIERLRDNKHVENVGNCCGAHIDLPCGLDFRIAATIIASVAYPQSPDCPECPDCSATSLSRGSGSRRSGAESGAGQRIAGTTDHDVPSLPGDGNCYG